MVRVTLGIPPSTENLIGPVVYDRVWVGCGNLVEQLVWNQVSEPIMDEVDDELLVSHKNE